MDSTKLKNFLLDLIFPKKCLNCAREGVFFCEDCLSLISINPFKYCLCEYPQKIINEKQCPKCRNKHLDGLYSATDYNQAQVRLLIHNFKYRGQIKELAYHLSFLILTHLYFIAKYFPPNSILIPMPLFIKRKKRRGFNQAEEIAKIISEKMHIPLATESLIRIKNTNPQVNLNKEQRILNIQNAFEVKNKNILKGKIAFLLDDVYTTGSTMEECARILKSAGVKQVWGITVARELK
jgi:ComF family protein